MDSFYELFVALLCLLRVEFLLQLLEELVLISQFLLRIETTYIFLEWRSH